MKHEWSSPVLEELDVKETAGSFSSPGDDGFGAFSS